MRVKTNCITLFNAKLAEIHDECVSQPCTVDSHCALELAVKCTFRRQLIVSYTADGLCHPATAQTSCRVDTQLNQIVSVCCCIISGRISIVRVNHQFEAFGFPFCPVRTIHSHQIFIIYNCHYLQFAVYHFKCHIASHQVGCVFFTPVRLSYRLEL